MGNVDILMVTETKINKSFQTSQFIMPGFTSPYRFDRNKDEGGILVYIREDIRSKLLNISYIAWYIECLGIEVNLQKVKWLVICSYNPHENYTSHHLENLSQCFSYKLLTQFPRYSGNEIGLSDFHAMNITVLKMLFSIQKYKTIFFRNHKKFDNSVFREALNKELLKYDFNNKIWCISNN